MRAARAGSSPKHWTHHLSCLPRARAVPGAVTPGVKLQSHTTGPGGGREAAGQGASQAPPGIVHPPSIFQQVPSVLPGGAVPKPRGEEKQRCFSKHPIYFGRAREQTAAPWQRCCLALGFLLWLEREKGAQKGKPQHAVPGWPCTPAKDTHLVPGVPWDHGGDLQPSWLPTPPHVASAAGRALLASCSGRGPGFI